MKALSFPALIIFFLLSGCAHGPDTAVSPTAPAAPPQTRQVTAVPDSAKIPPEPPVKSSATETDLYGDIQGPEVDYGNTEIPGKAGGETTGEIADPLEPFNRAMYQFNDRLYFWVLKPVAQGYGKVVPETARVSVSNFFTNVAFPIRFVNCLLQANFSGAAEELGRFTINTLWGVGGLLDPASSKEINLTKQDEDFGQTLGTYGLGQGFFINWPLLGPSSPRDTVGMVGDLFLTPSTYFSPWYAVAGIRAYEKVNSTSLKIGDYESLKEAAIDPYVAVRDAYIQYRLKKVHRQGGLSPGEKPAAPLN